MTLINLLCPHCGGNFELDPDRPLQSFWVCPYCGNRSLMQKHDETIRLRGIIPGRAQPATTPPTALVHEPSTVDNLFEPEPVIEKSPDIEPVASQTRPLEEIIAEAAAAVPDTTAPEPALEPEPAAQAEPVTEMTAAPDIDEKPVTPVSEFDQLCQLAETAANDRDLPLFNAYSRQALDLRPTDPRMYALRAELTEEADGFARATWTSLGWSLLTPRRKTALVAQQLYNLNTALKYSRKHQQSDLISRFAWQIMRQAIDHFTEQGQLRCQKRLFFRTFKGRFTRRDLQTTYYLLDALRLINRQTCPLAHEELLGALRVEISKSPQRLARRLRRL